MNLQVTIVSVHGTPGLHFEPLNLQNFHFDADPDPAFHSNPDQDPASQHNADPDPLTLSNIEARKGDLHLRVGLQHLTDDVWVAHQALGQRVIQHLTNKSINQQITASTSS
jgi:hypothetical protein